MRRTLDATARRAVAIRDDGRRRVLPAVAFVLLALVPCSASARGVDCDGNGTIDARDVAVGLSVAQGLKHLDRCRSLDRDRDGRLEREEIPEAAPNKIMWRYWTQVLREHWGMKGGPRWAAIDGPFRPEDQVRARNHGITSRYAQLFGLRPQSFLWAGCAAFISYQVGLGLGAYERLLPLVELDDLDLLRQINTAVFHDIAWAHLAYHAGGLPEVESGLQGVRGHEGLLDGFREIAKGEKLAEEDPERGRAAIWEGNELLLKHEQSGIIQDQMRQLGCLAARLLSLFLVVDFDADNFHFDCRTLTGFTRAMLRSARLGNVARLDDRWSWIKNEVLPRWETSLGENDFDQRLRTLVEAALRAENPVPMKAPQ